MSKIKTTIRTIKQGQTTIDRIIIGLSYIKIFFNRFVLKKYPYWIKLIKKVNIKNKKNVKYFGELLTYSEIHENKEFLNIILNKKYKHILDFGGHTGRISYIFVNKNQKCTSIYIEPNPNSYKIFKKLVDEEKIKNITLINKGISSTAGKLDFYLTSKFGGCSSFIKPKKYYKKIEVPVTTIDNLSKKINLSKIDLVKIDVEGHETEVLKGMRNFLKNRKETNILVEFNDKIAKQRFIEELKKMKINYHIKKISSADYYLKISRK